MTQRPALRLVHDAAAKGYKSRDQVAFEEAVTRKDAHTWLGTQNLGHFNVQLLHEHLIRGDAGSQPFLVGKAITKLHLQAFEPDVEDVKKALENTAFYHALLNVAKSRDVLPSAYRDAISDDKQTYAAIFRQELQHTKLSR